MQKSNKSYGIAVCLSAVFGILGIHHFYLNRWLHGFFDFGLALVAIYFIQKDDMVIGWSLLLSDILHTFVVTIMLLIGAYKDGNGDIVAYPGQENYTH